MKKVTTPISHFTNTSLHFTHTTFRSSSSSVFVLIKPSENNDNNDFTYILNKKPSPLICQAKEKGWNPKVTHTVGTFL